MHSKRWVLPIIVTAQFCCTSLWFAGNSIVPELTVAYDLSEQAIGHITSVVQFGFIAGTLIFALYTIADRHSPSKVFFISALLGATFNLLVAFSFNTFSTILILRFLTGFFLAGIYPVGMKIAADYFEKGLGRSLGFLVGALVLGTAFPHLIKTFSEGLPWRAVLYVTSAIAVIGGLLIYLLVPDGPYRKQSQKPDLSLWYKVFKNNSFRSAAFGYFGHMWELYTFWAFVPVMLIMYGEMHPIETFNIPLWSFIIIGLGGLACVVGGFVAESLGTKKTAAIALLLSGLCCLASPLLFFQSSSEVFLSFLIFWGLVVIADSPLFSTLVAQSASGENKGTALTITNCIGFSITIISIQLMSFLIKDMGNPWVLVILSMGPLLGLIGLYYARKKPVN